ncbi:hypothetical protein Misp05_13550 [Micromonospora sp. NBRC 107095]|nr:hypothetical protein Misp05_13550 [Micromonospora sp. NBRC 107095]
MTGTIVDTKMDSDGDANRRAQIRFRQPEQLFRTGTLPPVTQHTAAAGLASAQPAGRRSFMAVLLSLGRHPNDQTGAPSHNDEERP